MQDAWQDRGPRLFGSIQGPLVEILVPITDHHQLLHARWLACWLDAQEAARTMRTFLRGIESKWRGDSSRILGEALDDRHAMHLACVKFSHSLGPCPSYHSANPGRYALRHQVPSQLQ